MVIYTAQDHSSKAVNSDNPEVTVFDNSNIQKNYSGVTTPLTFSLTRRAYALVYRQTIQRLSLPSHVVVQSEDILQNILGLVKGRIFYNTNNWYKGLKLLPAFSQNKRDMERLLGFTDPLDLEDDLPKGFRKRCGNLPLVIANLTRLSISFNKLKTDVPRFLNQRQSFYTSFHKLDLGAMSFEELKAEKEKLDRNLSKDASVPVINNFYIMMTTGKLAKSLRYAGIEKPDEFLDLLLSVDNSSTNLKPAKNLNRLALMAASQPELKMLISRLPADIDKQVKERFQEFYQDVSKFINEYGDQAIGDLKLETQTIRMSPLVFYSYLRDCLTAHISDFRLTEQSQLKAIIELNKTVSSIHFFHKKWTLRKLVKLQKAVSYREMFKQERSRMIGMYRTLYIAMGKHFEKQKSIQSATDIFYLTEDEILSSAAEHKFKSLIEIRKEEFAGYKTETVPSRVVMMGSPFSGKISSDANQTSTVGKADVLFDQAS